MYVATWFKLFCEMWGKTHLLFANLQNNPVVNKVRRWHLMSLIQPNSSWKLNPTKNRSAYIRTNKFLKFKTQSNLIWDLKFTET